MSIPNSRSLLAFVVTVSGLAGLGYQMVWCRLMSVSLGHEIVAVLAVVAAFFVGLALGALTLNKALRQTNRPHLWYVGLELVIAFWALLLNYFMPHYNPLLANAIGPEPGALRHWLFAFGGSLLILLPATTAMGATLPAIERMISLYYRKSNQVASLYGFNTLGAVLGTLATTFWLIPACGLTTTIGFLALCNGICALVILFLLRSTRQEPIAPAEQIMQPLNIDSALLIRTLFFSGFLGIGYEILSIRMLSQILENTVYTFAAVLSVFLLGISAGAGVYQSRWAKTNVTASLWHSRLQWLLSGTGLGCLSAIPALMASGSVYQGIQSIMGVGVASALTGELCAASVVLFIPACFMGALFSHLAQQATRSSGLGMALSVNTLGSAIAPVLFGLFLLPWFGAKNALTGLATGYFLLIPHKLALAKSFTEPGNRVRVATVSFLSALSILLLALHFPMRFITVAEGSRVTGYQDGVMASVAVVEDHAGHRHLKVNNHFTMGGTASRLSDHLQSHIPLLLHGAPQSALYLGLGTGITFEASRYYPNLQATGVDLIPEILPLLPQFMENPDAPGTNHKPKPYLLAADARRYILSSQQQFDVIVAEIFHPSRDGAGSLYTREHFSAIRQRLAPNGKFCQWLPLFQLDLPTLKLIVRTFLHSFPEAQLHLGHLSLQQPILCLLGTNEQLRFQSPWLLPRVQDRALQQELVSVRLNSDLALFGGYLGGTEALRRFAGEGELNTDDHPLVTYQAPFFVYRNTELPARRLNSLVEVMTGLRKNVTPAEGEFGEQLQHYWQARDQFIAAGIGLRLNDDIEKLVQETKDPLLKAVAISPDFEPAYRTLIGLANGLYSENRYASYQLLNELERANPRHPAAHNLKQKLFGNAP